MYEDIIHLPHHVSPTRPPMSMQERAAQFSPFAALTGFDAAIQETGRLTQERIQLDEEALEILNQNLQILLEHLEEQPEVTVTYFQPDPRKHGGAYHTVAGTVQAIQIHQRLLVMEPGLKIPMDDILSIESHHFPIFGQE